MLELDKAPRREGSNYSLRKLEGSEGIVTSLNQQFEVLKQKKTCVIIPF